MSFGDLATIDYGEAFCAAYVWSSGTDEPNTTLMGELKRGELIILIDNELLRGSPGYRVLTRFGPGCVCATMIKHGTL